MKKEKDNRGRDMVINTNFIMTVRKATTYIVDENGKEIEQNPEDRIQELKEKE